MSIAPLDELAAWLAHGLAQPLSAVGVDALESPGRLPWILLLTVVCAIVAMRRRPAALSWPGMPEIRRAGGRRTEAMPAVAGLLRLGALLLLAVVAARPIAVDESPPEPGRGLDVILVLDTSASMRALDTSGAAPGDADVHDEFTQTRLDLAKRVVSRFATSRVAEGDRVGLVVFVERRTTALHNPAALLRYGSHVWSWARWKEKGGARCVLLAAALTTSGSSLVP